MSLFTSPPLRLRLLLLAVAVIVATTFLPLGFRHPSASYIDYKFNAADFINNLILYAPLGFALGGSTLRRAFLCGLCLSACAELLQLTYVDRVPSPVDVLSNTCGTLIGFAAALYFRRVLGYYPKSLSIPRPVAALAVPLAIFGTVVLLRYQPSSDFSNWNPAFHLAIGDELSGGRKWKGSLSKLAIYPFAMPPSSIDSLSRGAISAPAEPPIFEWQPRADFPTPTGRPLLSKQEELKLYAALVSRSKLTLLVWMRTNNLKQTGPARIVTYSRDSLNRNFTLGQMRDTLTFRLRTPASGPNGNNPALDSGPVLASDRPAFVAAVYDGRISRLYVDGKSAAQADVGAKRPRLSRRMAAWLPASVPVRGIELSTSEIFLSGLFALGLFAILPAPRRLPARALIGILAGAAIGGIIWFLGVSEPTEGFRILLECATAGLFVSVSLITPQLSAS